MGIKIDKINIKNLAPADNNDSQKLIIANIIVFACFFISRGYFAAAEKLLLGNLRAYPNEAKLWAVLGVLYAETNREQQALNSFNRTLELDPYNPDAIYYLGFFNNNLEIVRQAAEQYLDLLSKTNNLLEIARTANQLGQCCMLLEKMPEAFDAFIAAYRANPESDNLMVNLGSYYLTVAALADELDLADVQEEIIALLNKISRFSAEILGQPPVPVDRHSKAADVSKRLKITGRQLYEKARQINPRCGLSYLNLGIYYLSDKDYERAEGNFRKAIAINPRNPASHYNLGLALLFKAKIGECKQAEIEFDEARRLNHKNGNDFFFVGQMFLNTKAYPQAEKWFKVAFDVYRKAGGEDLFNAQYKAMLEQITDEEKINKAQEILEKCRSKP